MNFDRNFAHTKDEINDVLGTIKDAIKNGYYSFACDREKNFRFITQHNLNRKKLKKILLGIDVEDFCYSVRNRKSGFEKEILYIFGPTFENYNIDDEIEMVDAYVKFNVNAINNKGIVVLISFHEFNHPIPYSFK